MPNLTPIGNGASESKLQLVGKPKHSRSTSILDDVRMHGRRIYTVASERGMTVQDAVLDMVDSAEEEIDEAYRRGFAAGQRSMLVGFGRRAA